MAKKTSRISAIVGANTNGKQHDLNLLIDLGRGSKAGGGTNNSWGTWDSFQCYISVSLRGKGTMYLEQLKLYDEGTPEHTKAKENLDEVVATARLKYWSFIKDYLNGIFTKWDSTEANGALKITKTVEVPDPKDPEKMVKTEEVLLEAQRVSQNLLEEFKNGTPVEKRVAEAYDKRKQ
jgi:hypothetical protein